MTGGQATTLTFKGDDYLDIRELADRETGGNATAAIRLAVRQALESNPSGERYDALMRGEWRELRRQFDHVELTAIAAAVRDWQATPAAIGLLWDEISDAYQPAAIGADAPFGLGPGEIDRMVRKIRELTLTQSHALVYALEEAQRQAAASGEAVRWERLLGGPLRGNPAAD